MPRPKTRLIHPTELKLPVELTFEVWPALEVHGQMLPPMIDVTHVMLTVIGPGGKPRTIDITQGIDDDLRILLEDEIIEAYSENN
jgi:hypothetical protein